VKPLDDISLVTQVAVFRNKRAFDNDEGLNTGGMGVIAPNPYYTKTIEELERREK